MLTLSTANINAQFTVKRIACLKITVVSFSCAEQQSFCLRGHPLIHQMKGLQQNKYACWFRVVLTFLGEPAALTGNLGMRSANDRIRRVNAKANDTVSYLMLILCPFWLGYGEWQGLFRKAWELAGSYCGAVGGALPLSRGRVYVSFIA